ncbi:polysaccharide deacetylase family protein [Acetobacteraceae bacterium]|nr:polysaccharide deacetylase family protein [Candidatus Parcubacteria bacterium]
MKSTITKKNGFSLIALLVVVAGAISTIAFTTATYDKSYPVQPQVVIPAEIVEPVSAPKEISKKTTPTTNAFNLNNTGLLSPTVPTQQGEVLGAFFNPSPSSGITTVGATTTSVQTTSPKRIVISSKRSSGGGGNNSPSSPAPTTPVLLPDTAQPTVVLASPAGGETVSGTTTLLATASDPQISGEVQSGLKGVQFYLDGAAIGDFKTASPFELALDTTSYANGTHSVSVVATDIALNAATTSDTTITITNVAPLLPDTSAPTVGLTSPTAGATVAGTTTLIATASDPAVSGQLQSGLGSMKIYLDGALLAGPTSTSPFEFAFNSTLYADGAHTVVVVATDLALNTASTSGTTITFNNIPDPVSNPFTRGGVSLTFDDGLISHATTVAPVLNAHGQKGTFYIPTGLIGTAGYMTWADIQTLNGVDVEMGAHTVTHAELPTLSTAQMIDELQGSADALASYSVLGENFASPFGAYSIPMLAEVAKRFNSHRTFNHLALNKWPFNKYLLHVYPVTTATTVAEVKAQVQTAIAGDHWLIIVLHNIAEVVPAGDDGYGWTTANLEGLMTELQGLGVQTKTVREMLDMGPNLVPNYSFESGMSGWTTDAPSNVILDTGSNGSYPAPHNSVKMTGSATAAHLFSSTIPVNFGTTYGIRFFANASAVTSGAVGFYIDEYDSAGNWLPTSRHLGATGPQFTIDESYVYTPASATVANVVLQAYMEAGTVGEMFVDSAELFAQ